MDIIDINNRLMKFLHEEPSDSAFQLQRTCGHFDCELDRISEFAMKHDATGELELIYLSTLCRRQIADTMAFVDKIIESPEKLKPYQDCHALITSPEVKEVRASLVQRFSAIASLVSREKLIGDAKAFEDVLDDAAEAIFTDFKNLHFEVYIKSDRAVDGFKNFSSSVQVCNSLAEMLIRLEKSPDGIYVGYVQNPGTLDGWFGFFCKSNGNMFSYHERIDEEYVGQHENMRSGRYAERKAFDLFPYELCEVSEERDYKGYATEIHMGEERKFLDTANFAVFVRIVLSMAIISRLHAGQKIEGSPVIVNSLLASNLAQIEDKKEDTTALVKWEGSPIVKVSSSFNPPKFEVDKLLRGDYNPEFCHKEDEDSEGRGWFYGLNQDMVDAYGAGFKFDSDRLLASNSSRRLIGDAKTEQEFIGSAKRLRLSAYYEVRRQLAKYVGKRMDEDYEKFGGSAGLKQWYESALESRKDKIFAYCVEAYDRSMASGDKIVKFGSDERQEKGSKGRVSFLVRWSPLEIHVSTDERLYAMVYIPEKPIREFICPITGAKASIFFKFEFSTYKQVQEFLECDLPKFCVGWKTTYEYNGNSILDVTDPVGNLESPLKGRNNWVNSFNFDFVVSLSKRGLSKIRRTLCEK